MIIIPKLLVNNCNNKQEIHQLFNLMENMYHNSQHKVDIAQFLHKLLMH